MEFVEANVDAVQRNLIFKFNGYSITGMVTNGYGIGICLNVANYHMQIIFEMNYGNCYYRSGEVSFGETWTWNNWKKLNA